MARGRDVCEGWRQVEVPVPRCRQAWPTDRLHVVRPARHLRCPSFPEQSADDDAPLAAVFDHHGPTRLLSQSDQPTATRSKVSDSTKHRTCKYLNNIIEADHGALKRVIRPVRGFQTMKNGSRYNQGLRSDAKPQVDDEVRFVNKLFDVFKIAAWSTAL
jgi:hypothetical protein